MHGQQSQPVKQVHYKRFSAAPDVLAPTIWVRCRLNSCFGSPFLPHMSAAKRMGAVPWR